MEQCKKTYTEAVNYSKTIPVTKTSFHYLAANLYRLSLACEALGEHNEALQHLHEAKRIAKVGGSYRNWMLLVVLLKLKKQYEEMGSFDKSDQYFREAECVAEDIYLDDVSTIVETLKEAGKDLSKQVPALVKLGEWYLDKAKTTMNANDFTKADALFNAALVRSRHVRHDIDEDHILTRIVETYREFLGTFAKDNGDGMSADEIRNEIDSHAKWIAKERQSIKERVDQNPKMEDDEEIYAEKVYKVCQDIQDMYARLVSMLVKECEAMMGQPPCKYAIIALGSVARMEATPYSDLEFAILYEDETIGNKINYFRILSHFLHLKVINLGETILRAMAIKELNDFQSPDPDDNWFSDSFTPRGISFDGAMPWASKTALGRKATKDKPALELIRTPEHMAALQDEDIAVKEGYHLADIMTRVILLYGEQALLDDYNNQVVQKLNEKSYETIQESPLSVGITRGIRQIMDDITTYHPSNSFLKSPIGGLLNTKKHFYRLISLLLSGLGSVFDVRSPSPWQVISELRNQDIIAESDRINLKVCLSIANEIRLKQYLANCGQKERFSPVLQSPDAIEQFSSDPIYHDFDENTLVRLLSTSTDWHRRCDKFCLKCVQQGEVDASILRDHSFPTKAQVMINLYTRLQKFSKALEWINSVPKDSPDYAQCAFTRGRFHADKGENKKAIEWYETALKYSQDPIHRLVLHLNVASILVEFSHHNKAKKMLEKAIKLHDEIYGQGSVTLVLSQLMLQLGAVFTQLQDEPSVIKTLQAVEDMHKRITYCSDMDVIDLNLCMAVSNSQLGQIDQSLDRLNKALRLSHEIFGEDNLSSELLRIHMHAATIYGYCGRYHEAISLLERSLKRIESLYGDTPNKDKITCLAKLGDVFIQGNQIDNGVKTLKIALEQAKKMYPGQVPVADILNKLGMALQQAGRLDESLRYLLEGKEMSDKQIEGGNLTSNLLNNIGTCYIKLGKFFLAFQYFKDAVDNLDMTISTQNYHTLCMKMAITMTELNPVPLSEEDVQNMQSKLSSITQIFKINLSKKQKDEKGLKDMCRSNVNNLYQLGLSYKGQRDQRVVLECLEIARETAKRCGYYRCGRMVLVLLLLSLTNGEMRSFEKSRSYYEEARAMARSLPHEDDSILPEELGMIELMKK